MTNIHHLAERYVRDSAIQLRRMDESMVRARTLCPADLLELRRFLDEAQTARNGLVRDLEAFRHALSDEGEGVGRPHADAKSAIGTVGSEFEKTLAAIFDTRKL